MGNDSGKIITDELSKLFKVYDDRLNELFVCTRDEMNEANVHNLRVAIRRLIALSKFVNNILPNNYYPLLIAELKLILKSLNPLRDTQVQLLRVKRTISPDSLMMDFFFFLLKQERELIITNKNTLTQTLLDNINGLLFFIGMELKSQIIDNNVIKNKIIDYSGDIYKNLLETKQITIYGDLDSIHKLRLAFKKYRYTVEIFIGLFGIENSYYDHLKKFQNILGDIQDNNVFVKKLDLFISNRPLSIAECVSFKEKIIAQRLLLIETLKNNIELINDVNIRLFLPQN